MKLNRKLEYSVEALDYLLHRPQKVASVREISTACQIPEALLSKIMQRVKRTGIVRSIHGNQGGYQLAVPPTEISILRLSEALSDRKSPRDDRRSSAVAALNQRYEELLQSVSLEALVSPSATGSSLTVH